MRPQIFLLSLSVVLATADVDLNREGQPVEETIAQTSIDLSGSPSNEAFGTGNRPRANPIASVHRGQPNDTTTPIRTGGCLLSAWDEIYITDFLQEQLDDLSTSDHCWITKGVKGLKDKLQRNTTANPLNNITIPTCVRFNVTSSGNTFSIDFSENSYEVNGMTEDNFVLLTYIHREAHVIPVFSVPTTDLSICSYYHDHRFLPGIPLGTSVRGNTQSLYNGRTPTPRSDQVEA